MAGRLDVLAAAEAGLTDGEVLQLALQHATAALRGVGGMAHLRGPGRGEVLHLVTSSGLPRAALRGWRVLPADGPTTPARALREGRPVWRPAARAPAPAADPGQGRLFAAVAAVPLRAPGPPVGTLSVLLPEAAEPAAAEVTTVAAVADWAAERLRDTSRPPEASLSPGGPSLPSDIDQALRAVRVGAWEWDLATGRMAWTETMPALLGLDPDAFDGRVESWVALIHPDDLPSVVAETDRAVRSRGEAEYEYRVRRADGSWGWVRVHGRVVTDDEGTPVRMMGTMWDTTGAHSALESAGRALRQMSDGFLAVGEAGRVTFVNPRAERLLGDGRELTGRTLAELPRARSVPGLVERCRRVAARGEPDEFDARLPHGEGDGDGDELGWYHLRLTPVPDGLTIHIADVTERRLREAERSVLERAAGERAARIGELTAALSEAVTVQDVVAAVAEHVLPPFAGSAMAVYVVEEDRLHVVGAIGYDPEFLRRVDRLPLSGHTGHTMALRNHAPLFVESPEQWLELFPGTEDVLTGSGRRSWVFLPLVVSGRAVGSCVVSFDHPRRFSGEERTLLTAVSGLFAQAMGRARLFDLEHGRARKLQRALLPQHLPDLPAVTAAARYLPAGQGTEVGGDWYDVIPLAADRVALVIGDVMGHGLSEAATMGRLRTAVRTLSDLELPPDEVLQHLNDIVSDLGDDFYATCLYAVYDPTNRQCVVARAGHPPPAVLHPNGTVRFPSLAPNAPLGAAAPPIDTEELRLPDGAVVVFYTDGLVEAAGRDVDQGMAQLATALTGAWRDGRTRPEELCEAITSALLPEGQHTGDDAALLVARLHDLAADNVAAWSLPEDPVAAGQARDRVREQLAAWHLEALTTTTELVASELVGNVIRHARGPIRLRLLRSRSLICEVSDGSHTSPHVRRASETDESGRGLQLVAAVSRRWGTRFTPDGKSIWTEQPLPAPAAHDGGRSGDR